MKPKNDQKPNSKVIQHRVTLLFEFGLPSPPWMAYIVKKMNSSIAIELSVIGSFFAAFFLFAMAFNTPFSDLRMSFMPVYASLIVLCLICSIIAQGRIVPILTSTLALPMLMLFYIASENSSYYIDVMALLILCFSFPFLSRLATIKKRITNRASHNEQKKDNKSEMATQRKLSD